MSASPHLPAGGHCPGLPGESLSRLACLGVEATWLSPRLSLPQGEGGWRVLGLTRGQELEEPHLPHAHGAGHSSPRGHPGRMLGQVRSPNLVSPSLLGSPEKEAFKKRAKLQQENSEETDENDDNEAEEVSAPSPPLLLTQVPPCAWREGASGCHGDPHPSVPHLIPNGSARAAGGSGGSGWDSSRRGLATRGPGSDHPIPYLLTHLPPWACASGSPSPEAAPAQAGRDHWPSPNGALRLGGGRPR